MFRSIEQAEFSKVIDAHLAKPDHPLLAEGTTGLGKTRAYLRPLFETSKRVAICLATNQLIDQLVDGADMTLMRETYPDRTVGVFRSRRYFNDRYGDQEGGNLYDQQKEEARDADILVCTTSSVIFDQRLDGDYNGVTTREIILFDEADNIPELAALASELEITRTEQKDWGAIATTALEVAENLIAMPPKTISSELRAKAKIVKEIAKAPRVWYRGTGITDDGTVAVMHRLPGRLLKKIANRTSTIFVSATLSMRGSFNDFKKAMGLEEISGRSRRIEPSDHGELVFSFFTKDKLDSPEWLQTVVDQIEVAGEDGMTLVITGSHSLAQQISDKLKGNVTVRQRDETTTEAVARMGASKVLIAAGAWAGLDTPVVWKSIVIPRIPYGRPKTLYDVYHEEGDELQVGDDYSHYVDSRNAAARRLIQGFGRGLRSPDAVCSIILCDPRIVDFEDVCPTRFRAGWLEGRKVEVVQSKAERNPRLRKEALRYHGSRCQAECGFKPVILRQLEVHHLNPIAEADGEVRTTVDDVAVLCRNCHALAHAKGNDVVPLDKLKKIAAANNLKEKRTLLKL